MDSMSDEEEGGHDELDVAGVTVRGDNNRARTKQDRASDTDVARASGRVAMLCATAREEFAFVLSLTERIGQAKEVFALAKYKVEALPCAPAASRLEEMPERFTADYMDAMDDANMCVNDLRRITSEVLGPSLSGDESEDAEVMATDDGGGEVAEARRHNSTVAELVRKSLQVACDSYDKARSILIREMKRYAKIMATMMADAVADEDEVLFNVRGELVAASRASLINTTTTGRTYFDGLLNSGGWKSDIIGMHTL
jgi:hypothetical protein